MLKLTNVHKSFGKTEVLKGISLNVEKGSVTAIIGPSGAGKTTLLRCINFLEKADTGLLDFDDIHIDLEKDILLERHEVISLPEEWSDNDILKYELENSYESKRVSPTLFLNSFLHEISQNKEKPSRISNGKKIWEEISKIKDKNG